MSFGGEGYGERDRTGEEGGGPAYGRGPSGLTTTRTRLPDGEGGGGRPPVRPGRNLITVVGVVVLLIAAIAFANRSDGGSDGEGGTGGKDAGAARPTAPTGQKPVKGEEAGIASGFPQSEQGAESAAANYAVALGGDGMFDAPTRKDIVTAVYAPDVADKRQDALDKAYSDPEFLKKLGLSEKGEAPQGSTFISRTNPVGTKVVSFDDSRAKISVWYSSLFGLAGEGSKSPVIESWHTNTYDLKWVGDDWKVSDVKQKDGPTPVGRDQAASSAKEMAEAVEGYGGFTYAR
ncbi:hypothetical protein GCM10012287_17850 [Streptomyces daqingensis]|uniref:DUF8175 domain-containing protein n=1 Tax=Streptomyces daqingensis TaxID=1472640 RepID=A0ABQ2M4F7_9ACTN|nr:hypothetical protein [Streptomyces daqingensis]GGO46751.1 hypothetical protein GCM10012287_17850 [Streptomyces daqingensis]